MYDPVLLRRLALFLFLSGEYVMQFKVAWFDVYVFLPFFSEINILHWSLLSTLLWCEGSLVLNGKFLRYLKCNHVKLVLASIDICSKMFY